MWRQVERVGQGVAESTLAETGIAMGQAHWEVAAVCPVVETRSSIFKLSGAQNDC